MLQHSTKTIIVFLSLLINFTVKSQDSDQLATLTIVDNTPSSSHNYLMRLYSDSVEVSSGIYKGNEYLFYSYRMDGHPFFYSDDLSIGDILFDGILYKNVEFYYDTYLQQIILEHDKLSFAITIENDLIDYFKIFDHHYYKLEADSNETIKEGFYDLLFDGEVKLYAKRSKSLQKNIENQEVHQWFDIEDKHYVFKDGIYLKVKKKGSLLKILKDKKKVLKSHIKQQKITFGKFPEKGLARTIEYYNKLQQQ